MQPIASPSGLLPLTSLPLADPARYRAGVFCAPLPGAHGNSLTGLGLGQGDEQERAREGEKGTLIQLHSNRQTVLSKWKVSCLGV